MDLIAGDQVVFDSPLFGKIEALVLEASEEGVTVDHPVVKEAVRIPREWVVKDQSVKDAAWNLK